MSVRSRSMRCTRVQNVRMDGGAMPNDDYLTELMERIAPPRVAAAEALQLLLRACEAHPNDPRPLALLGGHFMEQRDLDRAEAAYLTALQRAPDFAIARFQLGLMQFTSGRPVVASTTWAALDALGEDHPLALFKRAFEHVAQDDLTQARRLLLEGIARNTANEALNHDMRVVLDRIGGSPEDTQGKEGAPQGHFLLSAYQKRP
jgi:Flp pilus assembly protein TadD